ncbi:MAG: AAA family ATPase [Clostridia bacterium]|nr:AAA family ATPase [Clostridia bacterium]
MDFEQIFREKYRAALLAARTNDKDATIARMSELYSAFDEQYKKNNNDSIVDKAKLSYWRDVFGNYIQIIRQNGLQDIRIQKFFGLIQTPTPSSAETQRGGVAKNIATPPSNSGETISYEGIFPNGDDDTKGKNESTDKNPNENGNDVPIFSADMPDDEGLNNPDEAAIDIVEPIAADDNPDGRELANPSWQNPDNEAPSVSPETVDENIIPSFEPTSLKNFIGQKHIVKAILKEIAIAKKEGRKHLDNILLFGNPGLGKTTLMKLIAKELGVDFEWLDCSQFRNSQQSLKALQIFFDRIAKNDVPVVIGMDEIHALNNDLQTSLLTLLNDRVFISPINTDGVITRIPIKEFTFIGATTDDDKVLGTIKNRCLRLTFQMVDYSDEELKEIYKMKVASKGLTITDEAIATCIPRSRRAMRYVNMIVDGLNTALYNDDGERVSTHIDLQVALDFFSDVGIDSIGLTKKDHEILNTLYDSPEFSMGVDALASRVGLDINKYQSEYEKYLIKIGFINISGKGRSLTELAIKHIKDNSEKDSKNTNHGKESEEEIDNALNDIINSVEPEEGSDELTGDKDVKNDECVDTELTAE